MISFEKKSKEVLREPDTESQVAAYLRGEPFAFDQISKYIEGVINQVIHTKKYPGYLNHIEDIRQECWMDALKNLKFWNPEKGTLKNFMFKCFSNKIMAYLYKNSTNNNFVPIEEFADTMPSTGNYICAEDLDIALETRFNGGAEEYVIRKVCVAVYIKTFDSCRNRIVKELREITKLSLRRIKFLIDYALVIIRKYCLEVGCRTGFSAVG